MPPLDQAQLNSKFELFYPFRVPKLEEETLGNGAFAVILKKFPDTPLDEFRITGQVRRPDLTCFKVFILEPIAYHREREVFLNMRVKDAFKACGRAYKLFTPLHTAHLNKVQFTHIVDNRPGALQYLPLARFTCSGTEWLKSNPHHTPKTTMRPHYRVRLLYFLFVVMSFLDVMHQARFLHMDVHASNTLFDLKDDVVHGVVSDYGAMQAIRDVNGTRTDVEKGTVQWRHTNSPSFGNPAVVPARFTGRGSEGPLVAKRLGVSSTLMEETWIKFSVEWQKHLVDHCTASTSTCSSKASTQQAASYAAWEQAVPETTPISDLLAPYVDFHAVAWTLMFAFGKRLGGNLVVSETQHKFNLSKPGAVQTAPGPYDHTCDTDNGNIINLLIGAPDRPQTAHTMFQSIYTYLDAVQMKEHGHHLDDSRWKEYLWADQLIDNTKTDNVFESKETEIATLARGGGASERNSGPLEEANPTTGEPGPNSEMENREQAEASAESPSPNPAAELQTNVQARRLQSQRLQAQRLQAQRFQAQIIQSQRLQAQIIQAEKAQAEKVAAAASLRAASLQIPTAFILPKVTCPVVTERVMRMVAAQVGLAEPSLFRVDFQESTKVFRVLSNTPDQGPEIAIPLANVSCLLDTIPEILMSYVVAQLLKIAQATDQVACDALILVARVNIDRKMRTLVTVQSKVSPL